MRYRRAKIAGGTYFFTVVTFGRARIFSSPGNVELLRQAMKYVMENHPFVIDAMVVLPDHLHCIWTLPRTDNDFPVRWRLIKSFFTRHCDEKYRQKISDARERKKEQAVWQRRYWEHTIKDEQDFMRHVEYIHYNPVKHGLVNASKDWQYSSFHRYVKQGLYPESWGAGVVLDFDAGVGYE
ncbi:transposase [uncultured Desulfobacter sp.]|uniref:REP-associated tyrosine transposase n=1 Tax=uncultured Desulfobacter sp. TaxID=240139 RepID=UPI002AA79B32|nr:transposase [uncultured Desulfobacter sp.]